MIAMTIDVLRSTMTYSQSHTNMADAALARREARRRKILENSHNRLQLISGKNSDDTHKESQICAPIPEYLQELRENDTLYEYSVSNGLINSENTSFEYSQISNVNAVDEVASDLTSLITSTPPDTSPPPTFIEKLANCKYDIVLVSFIIQFLYSIPLISIDSAYFFLPLFLYIVTKWYWYPRQSNFAIANALLLLNGLSASRVQKIISVTQLISTFSQDICVFLFTTICTQALFIYFKNVTT